MKAVRRFNSNTIRMITNSKADTQGNQPYKILRRWDHRLPKGRPNLKDRKFLKAQDLFLRLGRRLEVDRRFIKRLRNPSLRRKTFLAAQPMTTCLSRFLPSLSLPVLGFPRAAVQVTKGLSHDSLKRLSTSSTRSWTSGHSWKMLEIPETWSTAFSPPKRLTSKRFLQTILSITATWCTSPWTLTTLLRRSTPLQCPLNWTHRVRLASVLRSGTKASRRSLRHLTKSLRRSWNWAAKWSNRKEVAAREPQMIEAIKLLAWPVPWKEDNRLIALLFTRRHEVGLASLMSYPRATSWAKVAKEELLAMPLLTSIRLMPVNQLPLALGAVFMEDKHPSIHATCLPLEWQDSQQLNTKIKTIRAKGLRNQPNKARGTILDKAWVTTPPWRRGTTSTIRTTVTIRLR